LTGLYVDHVADRAGYWTKFSLVGRDLVPSDQSLALEIMRSVRFERHIPAEGSWETVAEIPDATLLDLEIKGDRELVVSGGVNGEGVIYEWSPTLVTPTLFAGSTAMAGLAAAGRSGDWAIQFGGHGAYRHVGGPWEEMLRSEEPLFDLAGQRGEVWVTGVGALFGFVNDSWFQVPGVRGGISLDLVGDTSGWTAGGHYLLRRADGVWEEQAWPQWPGESVTAVDGLSPYNAWFAGMNETTGRGSLFEWNDGEWTLLSGVADRPLWEIDLLSGAEGWAVGGDIGGDTGCEVLRLREGTWEPETDVCTGHLHAVEVDPQGRTWAVGYRSRPDGGRTGLILRRAGEDPTPTATAATPTTPPEPTLSPEPDATETPSGTVFLPWSMARQPTLPTGPRQQAVPGRDPSPATAP
jgi:hypothetical protein